MKIFLASDHAGFPLKEKIKAFLESQTVFDLGPSDDSRVDYPDFASKLAKKVLSEPSIGILVCGSGQGMAMRANKFKGIRAALCWNKESTELSRLHNDANILCLGSRLLDHDLALELVNTFLNTKFEGGRHKARVDKISGTL